MAGFMDNYQTVQERVDIFWRLFPNGRFSSDIVAITDTEVIVKASVWTERDQVAPTTVDYAQEPVLKDGKMAGMHVELAVTSSLGRAISQLGGELSPDKRKASQTEMEKAKRVESVKILTWAKEAYEALDVATLRECYTEAKEAGLDAALIADILRMGGEVSAKVNAPAGKENETAEAQA